MEMNACNLETISQTNQPVQCNTILDFSKITTQRLRKYVKIVVVDVYKYIGTTYDEHTFDIGDEEGANFVIMEFIKHNECSPELVFQVGICNDTECTAWCSSGTPTCKHRLAEIVYNDDYTYIRGYSETAYKINIVL